jgi:hypothetical protein
MQIGILISWILMLALQACSTQEFSGDAGTQRVVKPKPSIKTGPNADIPLKEDNPVTPDSSQVIVDDGGKELKCDPNSMVSDPNATETISGPQNLVNIVNGVCGQKLLNQYYGNGSVHHDSKTANAVCRFKGYQTGQLTQKPGKYTTPGNNFIGMWEGQDVTAVTDLSPITGSFNVYKATKSNNKMMALTCRGKLKAVCVPKVQTINCK